MTKRLSISVRAGLTIIVALSLLLATPAAADLVEWRMPDGGNAHYYEYVADVAMPWTSARAAAELRSWGGHAGYLATITSPQENDFIATAFSEQWPLGAWLGGWQDEGMAPADGWHWVTGEDWSYTNWSPGEPNDYGGHDELFLDMLGTGPFPVGGERGRWNDSQDEGPGSWTGGYVVEYPVPEPLSIGLLMMGAAGLLRRSSVR